MHASSYYSPSKNTGYRRRALHQFKTAPTGRELLTQGERSDDGIDHLATRLGVGTHGTKRIS